MTITETPGGSVPTLQVHNGSDSLVLLVAGEVVFGGYQDRMVTNSVLLVPGTTEITVACVEAGRWGGDTTFGLRTGLAPRQLRSKTIYASTDGQVDQGEVWHEVAERLSSQGSTHDTGSLRAAMNKDFYDDSDSYVLRPFAQQCGVAISHGKTMLGVELFTSRAVLDLYWDAIVDAYDSDVLVDCQDQLGSVEVLEFLQCGVRGLQPLEDFYQGVQYRSSDPHLSTNALVDIDTLIHLSVLTAA